VPTTSSFALSALTKVAISRLRSLTSAPWRSTSSSAANSRSHPAISLLSGPHQHRRICIDRVYTVLYPLDRPPKASRQTLPFQNGFLHSDRCVRGYSSTNSCFENQWLAISNGKRPSTRSAACPRPSGSDSSKRNESERDISHFTQTPTLGWRSSNSWRMIMSGFSMN